MLLKQYKTLEAQLRWRLNSSWRAPPFSSNDDTKYLYSWAGFFSFFFDDLTEQRWPPLIPVAFSQIIVAAQAGLPQQLHKQPGISICCGCGIASLRRSPPAAPWRKWGRCLYSEQQQRIISKRTLNNLRRGFLFISERLEHLGGFARTKDGAPQWQCRKTKWSPAPLFQQGQSDWAGWS